MSRGPPDTVEPMAGKPVAGVPDESFTPYAGDLEPDEEYDGFGFDELGLDKVDRAILDVLCRRFAGRPVGLTTLAYGSAFWIET